MAHGVIGGRTKLECARELIGLTDYKFALRIAAHLLLSPFSSSRHGVVSENSNESDRIAVSEVREKLAAMISRLQAYLLLGILSVWLNWQQQVGIDFLHKENEIPKRQLNGQRPRLTDEEQRRLA